MKPPGENDVPAPARLRARLAALKGLAPAPACHVIWRATTAPIAPEVSGYELPDEAGRKTQPEFETWLTTRNLAGAERLAVSILVIREHLDDSGLVRECVLERRRGDVEGPYHGNVARVEFVGAGQGIRRFRALRDGRLAELPRDPAGAALSPDDAMDEGFAGDDEAVRAYLGADCVIVARRPPSAAEDLIGFSAIIHARRADGVEVGCGVGWHGDVAFVIAADFPRHGLSSAAPVDLEAVAAAAIKSRDLIRYETRHDERGFCVIARERGQLSLLSIRPSGPVAQIEPYQPGRTDAANDDQRHWMTYAETYEARAILDSWRIAGSDEIAVVTIDPDKEAWRHVIDADGIEVSRQSANESGAAALYRERLDPPEEPSIANSATPSGDVPEDEPPTGSLLTLVLAWSQVTAIRAEMNEAATARSGLIPASIVERLGGLTEPLATLSANLSLGALNRLVEQARAGAMAPEAFTASVDHLIIRLRDELALTRIVVLASGRASADGEPPFGSLVELHFPAAAYDIEEAMLCLAMRRSTAAVLHAMKVMRHGLTGVERLLATPKLTDLTWARLIAATRAAPGDNHELIEALIRVRRSWRSPDLMPAVQHTEAEAEAVLAAVASFMRALAVRLDGRRESSAG